MASRAREVHVGINDEGVARHDAHREKGSTILQEQRAVSTVRTQSYIVRPAAKAS